MLSERSAIVTGASQGLGLAIARRFVEAGANVLICARDDTTLTNAKSELIELARSDQMIVAVRADVSRQSDVAAMVDTALRTFGTVQILVNNAAVLGPCGPVETQDWGEWVRTLEINLLGAVLACRGLLPHLRQRKYGKIIQLSGGGAAGPLPMMSGYAASKAAVVRFAETLAHETQGQGIDVNALAPGVLNTRMLKQMLDAGPDKIGAAFHHRLAGQAADCEEHVLRAADLAVFLASSRSDGITGRLLSAVWDPWEKLPEYAAGLHGSDVYTVRRIVPEDRALDWSTPD